MRPPPVLQPRVQLLRALLAARFRVQLGSSVQHAVDAPASREKRDSGRSTRAVNSAVVLYRTPVFQSRQTHGGYPPQLQNTSRAYLLPRAAYNRKNTPLTPAKCCRAAASRGGEALGRARQRGCSRFC